MLLQTRIQTLCGFAGSTLRCLKHSLAWLPLYPKITISKSHRLLSRPKLQYWSLGRLTTFLSSYALLDLQSTKLLGLCWKVDICIFLADDTYLFVFLMISIYFVMECNAVTLSCVRWS